MSKHEVISMEKCPVCKRSFVYNRMSIYKIKNRRNGKIKWYCSYTCWRKAGGDQNKSSSKVQKELSGLQ